MSRVAGNGHRYLTAELTMCLTLRPFLHQANSGAQDQTPHGNDLDARHRHTHTQERPPR